MRISDWSSDVCSSDLQVGADCAADHTAEREPAEQNAVDIAEAPMGDAGRAGGEHHGGMDAGARDRRGNAETQENGRAGKPVGHADRAVHELRSKAHGGEQKAIDRKSTHLTYSH